MLWFGISVIGSLLIGLYLFYGFPVLSLNKQTSFPVPKISIIVPARNEEANLPGLLNSLKNQSILPYEVIVVDDNSEDGTKKVATEFNAQVVSSPALPEGWLGKPWVCYQGALTAKGDIFIFLDADTFLEPDGLEKMVNMYMTDACVISVFPYHRIKKFHETFSAIFNLMQLVGMYQISITSNKKPIGMFGPCLIISREDYFIIGGHRSVRSEVLEHYMMTETLKKHNIPIHLFRGKGAINVRMYPKGWKSLTAGWSKSFLKGADHTPRLNMSLSVMWISGLVVSLVFLILSVLSKDPINVLFWFVLYMISVFQVFVLFRRVGNFPVWSSVFYPVNLIFFLILFTFSAYRSSRNRRVEWKGRKIN